MVSKAILPLAATVVSEDAAAGDVALTKILEESHEILLGGGERDALDKH